MRDPARPRGVAVTAVSRRGRQTLAGSAGGNGGDCSLRWRKLYRFASMSGALGGFEDDEFVTLAYAQQMLLGDLPVRDFAENGSPLMHAISAGAIRWIGAVLLAEAVMTMGMLAICVVILFLLAERASGSIPIAATVAVLCIAIAPRFYNYPKLLVYAIALPAVWAYIDQPRRSRLLLMAAAGVIAFLLRDHHGVYVAVAAILAVAVAGWPDARRSFRECAVLGVMALALVSPYLLYVQWHDGAYAYLQAFTSFARRAQSETNWKPVPFNLDWRLPLIMRVTPAADRPSVNVRWVSGLTDDTREAAERELGLARNEYLREVHLEIRAERLVDGPTPFHRHRSTRCGHAGHRSDRVRAERS